MSDQTIFPDWHYSRWHAVDDRVRGGSSTSNLDPVKSGSSAARFWGHLDIDTLGGAGFASQRYVFGPDPLHLPRHRFQGIRVVTVADNDETHTHDAKTFTITLKTTFNPNPPSKPKLPPSPEPASLSYEASFTPSTQLGKGKQTFQLAFDDFKPTYRGREVPRDDPKYQPLHTEKVYELSLMCRSSFGDQKGDYSVIIEKIEGIGKERSSWLGGTWAVVCAIFSGFWTWLWSADGRVQLPDEEKHGLL